MTSFTCPTPFTISATIHSRSCIASHFNTRHDHCPSSLKAGGISITTTIQSIIVKHICFAIISPTTTTGTTECCICNAGSIDRSVCGIPSIRLLKYIPCQFHRCRTNAQPMQVRARYPCLLGESIQEGVRYSYEAGTAGEITWRA